MPSEKIHSGGTVRQREEKHHSKVGGRICRTTGKDNGKWARYSGGVWSRLQETARTIQAEYDGGGHSETTLHRLADQLREVCGGARVAKELIPRSWLSIKRLWNGGWSGC